MEKVFLHNTDGRRVSEFIPLVPGQVGMYCCGPTVYNYAHIGNLRTFVNEDLLKRVLTISGYKVKHVMNITDVGHLTGDSDDGLDKVATAAQKMGKTSTEVARFYEDAFKKDLSSLNIESANVTPRATEHINEMISLIERLIEAGHAYVSNGNVYYSVASFPEYGKMAGFEIKDNTAGTRIAVDQAKKDPADFALWFTNGKFKNQEMQWPSPWGVGYPGWHIECSAMSMKYLGEQFDIHCGGVDAIKVHHTNEIAQSEGATGKKWVNWWVHSEFLVLGKDKMSKSEGNFLTLSSLVEDGFDPLSYRYLCLLTHYRKQLSFSAEALKGAQKALLSSKARIASLMTEAHLNNVESVPNGDTLTGEAARLLGEALGALRNDIGVPQAVGIWQKALKSGDLGASEKLSITKELDKVFGLSLFSIPQPSKEPLATPDAPKEVIDLAEERMRAKQNKDWAKADEIRNKIASLGYTVVDKSGGYTLTKTPGAN